MIYIFLTIFLYCKDSLLFGKNSLAKRMRKKGRKSMRLYVCVCVLFLSIIYDLSAYESTFCFFIYTHVTDFDTLNAVICKIV